MTAAPVSIEPEVTIKAWAFVMHCGGDIHLTGLRDNRKARVSSAVESFDRETMTATTISGRKYHLEGMPFDRLGIMLARLHWGSEEAEGCKIVSPEDVELALSPAPSPFRH
ncbi:hypothetical protein [Mesorhizobium sp. A623]